MKIVVYKPVSELHIEIFMRGECIFVPEMIIDHPPESLYLSIGLWSPDLGILMDDLKLDEKCLEAMELICFALFVLVMCREFESVI
jgi:hypothetical protein